MNQLVELTSANIQNVVDQQHVMVFDPATGNMIECVVDVPTWMPGIYLTTADSMTWDEIERLNRQTDAKQLGYEDGIKHLRPKNGPNNYALQPFHVMAKLLDSKEYEFK